MIGRDDVRPKPSRRVPRGPRERLCGRRRIVVNFFFFFCYWLWVLKSHKYYGIKLSGKSLYPIRVFLIVIVEKSRITRISDVVDVQLKLIGSIEYLFFHFWTSCAIIFSTVWNEVTKHPICRNFTTARLKSSCNLLLQKLKRFIHLVYSCKFATRKAY